jgi:hypothetical protein
MRGSASIEARFVLTSSACARFSLPRGWVFCGTRRDGPKQVDRFVGPGESAHRARASVRAALSAVHARRVCVRTYLAV